MSLANGGLHRFKSNRLDLKQGSVYVNGSVVSKNVQAKDIVVEKKIVVKEVVFKDNTAISTAQRPLETANMFENNAVNDFVQNPIGNVPNNMTVSQIRTQYPELDDLIRAMLKIEPTPPTAPQARLMSVVFDFNNAVVEVGTQHTFMPALKAYRGDWHPNATSPDPNPPPRGFVTQAQLTAPIESLTTGGYVDTPLPLIIPNDQGHQVRLERPQQLTYSSTSLRQLNFTTGFATFAAGEVVYNNYGTPVNAMPAGSLSVSNSRNIRFYAKIYRNGNQNSVAPGPSGVQGTLRVFHDTTEVYITQHANNDVIDVPKEPMQWHQFNPFAAGDKWAECDLGTQWSKEYITLSQGTLNQDVNYWRLRWLSNPIRLAADVRLTF